MSILFNKATALVILCCSLVVSNSTDAKSNNIGEKQARKYISHIVDTLFAPRSVADSYTKELNVFTARATNILLSKYGKYPSYTSIYREYNPDELYNGIVNESVNFIEQKSLQYAQEIIKKFSIPAAINQKNIINNAVSKIRSEATNFINQSDMLDTGALKPFFGMALYDKLWATLKKDIEQAIASLPKPKPPVYTTPECPVCLEDFSAQIKRITLNCGHNLCSFCLKDWYKEKASRATCPCCRATITNIASLVGGIQDPVTYPTIECPVCLDDFDKVTKRLYLTCGHNICTACLRSWYNAKGNKANCPTCGANIVITDFSKQLWPTR